MGYILELRKTLGSRPLIMAGAGVILINKNGEVLLQKRSDNGCWDYPAGSMELGESFEECARREVLEETGIDVSCADGGYQFCYHREQPGQNYIVDIYRFDMDITEKEIKLQNDEDIDGRLATLDEIRAVADQGKFLHYNSIKRVFES